MRVVLSPMMQRATAIGLALVVVMLLLWLIVAPLWSASALHAEHVGMLKRQVRSMQGLAEAAPKYEALAKRLAADSQAQLLTYSAPQATLAIAQLQGQISQIMATAGAAVTTSQPMPESSVGALTKVTVQTTLEAEIKSLLAALHAIGAARPLMRVEKLTIRDPDGEWANAPQASAPNKLQVDLTISAYMRRP